MRRFLWVLVACAAVVGEIANAATVIIDFEDLRVDDR